MHTKTVAVLGTNTYTGDWVKFNHGARYNVSQLFKFTGTCTGSLKLEWTASKEQDITNGSAVIDDLDVVDASGTVSPIAVVSATDPTESIFLRDLTAGAVRWSYTNATGAAILQVDTISTKV
jgi:hypothetical protein